MKTLKAAAELQPSSHASRFLKDYFTLSAIVTIQPSGS